MSTAPDTDLALDVERVWKKLLVNLGLRDEELSRTERTREKRILGRLLRQYDADTLEDVIEFGMSEIWPYSTGQPFTAHDIRGNITKALAAVGRARRSGRILLGPDDLEAFEPGEDNEG